MNNSNLLPFDVSKNCWLIGKQNAASDLGLHCLLRLVCPNKQSNYSLTRASTVNMLLPIKYGPVLRIQIWICVISPVENLQSLNFLENIMRIKDFFLGRLNWKKKCLYACGEQRFISAVYRNVGYLYRKWSWFWLVEMKHVFWQFIHVRFEFNFDIIAFPESVYSP